MSSILIVESGATKTDWCLINSSGEKEFFKTPGMNPLLQTKEEAEKIMEAELHIDREKAIDKIVYYGAGVSDEATQEKVKDLLSTYFNSSDIEAHSDLLAAARGTAGKEKGMVCILGTGSNSGYYNGEKFEKQIPSLGYVIGDEGGGAYLGKRLLQYYYYQSLGSELTPIFKERFGDNLSEVLDNIYRKPFPNRYLASFVPFIKEYKEHFVMKQLLSYAFTDFYQRHLLNYAECHQYPVHFVGSIAYEFRSELMELQLQYGLRTGKIVRSPLDGICLYHQEG